MDSKINIMIESFKQSHPKSKLHKPKNIYEALEILSTDNIVNETNLTMESMERIHYYNESIDLIEESIKEDNTFKWPYSVAPYFVKEEIKNLKDYYYEAFASYSSGDGLNPVSIYRKIEDLKYRLRNTEDPEEIGKIKAELDSLGDFSGEADSLLTEATTGTKFEPLSWNRKIVRLMNQLKVEEDPEKINIIKQSILNLGWNPEVDYTTENQIKAKKRIEKIYQESHNIFVLDLKSMIEKFDDSNNIAISENVDVSFKPLHVIISRINNQFFYIGLCIDNNFNEFYSFDLNNNPVDGFSLRYINNDFSDNKLAVFSFFVSDDNYTKIKEKINMIMDAKYNNINIPFIPFENIDTNFSDVIICSQFVDWILKMINTDNASDEYFYKSLKSNGKIYKTFDGMKKDFNYDKVINYMDRMAKTKPFYFETSYGIANDYLIPSIVEAALPIQFNKDGDVLLTNKIIDFDAEYSSSHKLLISYEKTNNIEGMKYELARLYYINYILERKLYHNKFLKNKEKHIRTRARVLNDFKKYLGFILKREPEFNFGEYYEKSIFYPHTVQIKKSTLLAVKDIIKYIL